RSLSMTRLLTLTGAGGCGKTRLAVEAARGLVGAYPDGVWMARFAPVSDGSLVAGTVAAALGVREQPGRPMAVTLSEYLRTKDVLLVLDNCEHVIDEAARLADELLESCGRLRVLATSREALGVSGEVVWRVSTLTSPEEGEPLENLIQSAAVRLFVDRARSKLPTFGVTEANARSVSEVCRRLDGIPLAIELAAARMAVLAVEQVAEKLNDSLNLLALGERTAEPRHKTMRATLEWSHDLLDEKEKTLFHSLSVFAGGWTLEAAEEVGGEAASVLDPLESLVEKSLVAAEVDGERGMRYRMLEPVRQYAREKLDASGEVEEVRGRHAEYYLAFGEAAESELMGSRPSARIESLGMEIGNLRAALSWMLGAGEERAEMGLRLAAALGRFWDAHGPAEGRRWIEAALAESGERAAPVRAKALNAAGFIAVYEGDPAGTALLDESLALYRKLGDTSGAAYAIGNLGHAMVHVGPRERMEPLRREVEAMLPKTSDERARAHLFACLGFVAAGEYDFEEMKVRLEEALVLFRELGDVHNVSVCVTSLGYLYIGRDDPGGAACFEEGLRIQRELKHQIGIFMGASGMAGVAALLGQAKRAAKLMGFSEAQRERIGINFESLSKARYDYEKYIAAISSHLDEAVIEAAWNEGRAMTSEEAIEYALSDEDTGERAGGERARASRGEPSAILTRREREVASLVGRGLTNPQIADALAISKNTVANHVATILKKLDLPSRS
ncbi:MAG: LuxR C-terminal-related transcriptional regulator, partial [Rubrobacteraceae bacterium]